MTAEVDPTYTTDSRPLEYREPASEVARLVQMPSHLIDGYSLSDAYMVDFRNAQRAARALKEKP